MIKFNYGEALLFWSLKAQMWKKDDRQIVVVWLVNEKRDSTGGKQKFLAQKALELKGK